MSKAPIEDQLIGKALSAREKEIWELIVKGLKSREVAKKLKVDSRTVETFRERLRQKLGAKNTAELIAKWYTEKEEILKRKPVKGNVGRGLSALSLIVLKLCDNPDGKLIAALQENRTTKKLKYSLITSLVQHGYLERIGYAKYRTTAKGKGAFREMKK